MMAGHHHTEPIGLVTGAATALLAHAANWVSASTFGGELLQTALFGLVGGAAGMVGRIIIDRFSNKTKKTKNENDNNNP